MSSFPDIFDMQNLLYSTLLEIVMSNNTYLLHFFFTKVLESQSDFFDICIDFNDKPFDRTVFFLHTWQSVSQCGKKQARSLCGTISVELLLYLSNWRLQRSQHFLGNTACFSFITFIWKRSLITSLYDSLLTGCLYFVWMLILLPQTRHNKASLWRWSSSPPSLKIEASS